MTVNKLTPNLYTDDVESCVKFWVERMNFVKTVSVPDEGKLVFAALQAGNIELMYGTWESLEQDAAVSASIQKGTSFLFIEVDDLDAVLKTMDGVPLILPVHETFYGSTEFSVKDPAGHLITFAHFAGQ
jgi:uncharacterized glyoxalase superfamily protein PhnB